MRARLPSYAQLLPVPRAGTRVAAPCAQMRARLQGGGIGAGQLGSLGAAVGVPAAPGSVDVTATPGLCPSCPRMRARLSGARGIGTGRDAIVRADGECARVCPRIRSPQSRGLPAPRVQAAPARRECACVCGWVCGWFRNAEHPQTSGLRVFWQIVFGGVLLSHTLSSAVPSALEGLASGFGMGPGVSPPLWPP